MTEREREILDRLIADAEREQAQIGAALDDADDDGVDDDLRRGWARFG